MSLARRLVLVATAAAVLAAPAAAAAPKPRVTLHLCGDYTAPVRSGAGNSNVRKFLSSNAPVQLSSGSTYADEAGCESGEGGNGSYSWTLDHSSSVVDRGQGRQHGTEHGTWSVSLDDGSSAAGRFNGRISLDTCDTATADGVCWTSAGRINSDADGEDADPEAPAGQHWNGSYTTTVTASGCDGEEGCSFESRTVFTYKVLPNGEEDNGEEG